VGTIHIDLFATLDLVGQAPGGPEEDPEGGFPFGGWQAPLLDETGGRQVWAGMQGLDALLLGRKTYDIWADFWPYQDDDIGRLFSRVPKYVASRGNPQLGWAGSTLLGPDLVRAVREVRDKHEQVHVIGSLDLVRTLLRERLFDRLNLWIYPVVLGVGKKVFEGGEVPAALELREPALTTPTGAVLLRYGLRPGAPGTGDMTQR
jgi:dihydrofolate reductase